MAKIAKITAGSVGRHRILGRDRDGRNLEEKVCSLYSEKFIDRDGNEIDLPLESGRIRSTDGARAGQVMREEYIRDAMGLPVAECPYSERYRHLVHGPLVAPPEGMKACDGATGGCSHLKAEVARRLSAQRDAAAVRKKPLRSGDAAAEQVGLAVARSIQAFAESQNASSPGVQEIRKKMQAGKGEVA